MKTGEFLAIEGTLLGMVLFCRQVYKEAYQAELKGKIVSLCKFRILQSWTHDYVAVVLENGVERKGFVREVRRDSCVLDKRLPRRVRGVWVTPRDVEGAEVLYSECIPLKRIQKMRCEFRVAK